MPKPGPRNQRAPARAAGGELIGPKEAAAELGISVSTVRRLWEARLLAGFMPAPRCLNLYRASVERLKRASSDPEFWRRNSLN
jgi:hypothetical protein